MTIAEIKALLLRDEALSRLDVPRGRTEAYADEAARTTAQALVGEQAERDAIARVRAAMTLDAIAPPACPTCGVIHKCRLCGDLRVGWLHGYINPRWPADWAGWYCEACAREGDRPEWRASTEHGSEVAR